MSEGNFALSGVIPPMITPLSLDGAVDEAGLEKLVTHMLDGGVSGIFVLGSSGEGPWLTASQQRQVIHQTRCAAQGRVPVLAGVIEPSTGRALEAMDRHIQAGADIIVIASPYYYAADQAVQIRHIETLVTAASVPVLLYNIPPTTHNPITPDTVQKVMHLENLLGVKDSAGNWDDFQKLLRLRDQRPGFVIFQGAEKLAVDSLIAGADGVVPGLGNIVPALFSQMAQYAADGKLDAAHNIQEEIGELWRLHTFDYWLVCLKAAASMLGFGSGTSCGHPSNLAPMIARSSRNWCTMRCSSALDKCVIEEKVSYFGNFYLALA